MFNSIWGQGGIVFCFFSEDNMDNVTTQFTTLAPASETGNNIFIPALQIRLKIVTFASASK